MNCRDECVSEAKRRAEAKASKCLEASSGSPFDTKSCRDADPEEVEFCEKVCSGFSVQREQNKKLEKEWDDWREKNRKLQREQWRREKEAEKKKNNQKPSTPLKPQPVGPGKKAP